MARLPDRSALRSMTFPVGLYLSRCAVSISKFGRADQVLKNAYSMSSSEEVLTLGVGCKIRNENNFHFTPFSQLVKDWRSYHQVFAQIAHVNRPKLQIFVVAKT